MRPGISILLPLAAQLWAASPDAQDAAPPKAQEFHGIFQRWTAAYLDFLFAEIHEGVQALASPDPGAQTESGRTPPDIPLPAASANNPIGSWITNLAGRTLGDLASGTVELASAGPSSSAPERPPVDLSEIPRLPPVVEDESPEDTSDEIGPLTQEKFNEENAQRVLREMGRGQDAGEPGFGPVTLSSIRPGGRRRAAAAQAAEEKPKLQEFIRFPVFAAGDIRPSRIQPSRVRRSSVRSGFDTWSGGSPSYYQTGP